MKQISMSSLTSIFSRRERNMNNAKSGKLRKVLSKISGAFMLPISVMSIGGLFLGIGAAIASNSSSIAGKQFGEFIQQLGNPVFAILPLLFAIGIVVAFTDEAGVAVFATVIGYMIFVAIQSVFITADQYVNVLERDAQPLSEAAKTFLKDNNQTAVVAFKKAVESATALTATDKTSLLAFTAKTTTGYTILFGGAGRNPIELEKLVGAFAGYNSLQTSVFGGIIVGFTTQWIYNKFYTIQLPQFISFYGGKRFVSIVNIPVMALLAILFLIFWPWIGIILNKIGQGIGSAPYGVESLIFGYIERSLIPFGLHHVFYAPLWFSSVGGDAGEALISGLAKIKPEDEGSQVIFGANTNALLTAIEQNKSAFQGDSTASLQLLKFGNFVDYKIGDKEFNIPLFEFLADNGFKAGRFADGKFSGMMFGLPAAAVAMIMAAPKENRRVATGTVFPAALTSFITGVTEPIEFTFLFLSPFLFWGFHAFFMALSFLFANLAGVHIPQAFSGGALDLILYGIVPVQKGTHFWWVLVVGLAYAPIYYFAFYFYIKYQNLETPGRGGNTKLFTKADYLKRKDDKSASQTVDPQVLAIIEGYGGIDNISAFNNCASRLRYDVKDLSKVSEAKLKQAGAVAIKIEGQHHVQAILGPIAEQLNAKIKSQRDEIINLQLSKKDATMSTETSFVEEKTIDIFAPAYGELIKLEEVSDDVFAAKLMGDGFAIRVGKTGKATIHAPISGKVKMVFDTKHAIGFVSEDETLQVLIHMGIDTVNLKGLGFIANVKVGDTVKAGEPIATMDLDELSANGVENTDVITVVLPESKKTKVDIKVENQKIDDIFAFSIAQAS
ncbi:glucose PTS transporter subunit IIA [Mesomycoplasma conjunctivae]|uniref:PTS transporter subunit IIABC n=1 Tax=Mesomycoplasma conjunctivae TaxID=45361 RepID=UPI003DA350D7